jgi:hypothetical protein
MGEQAKSGARLAPSLPAEEAEKLIDQRRIEIRSSLRNARNKKLDDLDRQAKSEFRKQDEKRQAISEPLSTYTKRMITKEQSLLRHIFGISAAIVFVLSVTCSLVVAVTADAATLERVVQIAKDIALPFVSVVLGFYFGATAKT